MQDLTTGEQRSLTSTNGAEFSDLTRPRWSSERQGRLISYADPVPRGPTMNGFKKFLLRGNVVDLAIAVVIGAAFGAVVQALVKDLITP